MAPKKLKPFRVSYYFADSAIDGKARLWTRYVKATTAEEAKARVVSVFAGTPGELVIVNAYLHYKTPVRAKKAFFVEVPSTNSTSIRNVQRVDLGVPGVNAFSFDSGPTNPGEAPSVPLSTILAPTPIVRPAGPCQWHPDAILEADGRCPALDSSRVPRTTLVILFFSAAIAVPCFFFGTKAVGRAILHFLIPTH